MQTSHTNSSLTCARRCLREWYLRYGLRLERDTDEEREALAVGTCWHKAHDAHALDDQMFDPHDILPGHFGERAYAAIRDHAPNELWAVKLSRLFAAYHWYWQDELDVVESEKTWSAEIGGQSFEGQMDGVVALADGRRALLERKTTSDSLAPESLYWSRLRLDPQVGIYALAWGPDKLPSAIIYDVVRKPTINPKGIPKKDAQRLRMELHTRGRANYYSEVFGEDEIEQALYDGRETPGMYGARLTADIGDRPHHYFARREVARTQRDYETLVEDLRMQVRMLNRAVDLGEFPRNPDSCATFGLCDFFALCQNNVCPAADETPEGYRVREHLHPELA